MEIKMIKHFINEGVEHGYYLVNGKIVIQNGNEYKCVPFFKNKSIKDSVVDVTKSVIEQINQHLAEIEK